MSSFVDKRNKGVKYSIIFIHHVFIYSFIHSFIHLYLEAFRLDEAVFLQEFDECQFHLEQNQPHAYTLAGTYPERQEGVGV